MNFWKIIQKQIYNILSQKYYVVCFTFLVLTTLLSLIHICEVWLQRSWSVKDKLWFNYFMDNIGNQKLHGNLTQYLPIDVVYTWVNGSDPLFRSQLADYRRSLAITSSAECPYANCLPSNFIATKQGTGVDSLSGYSDFKIVSSSMSSDKWKMVALDSPESVVSRLRDAEGDIHQVHWTTDSSLANIYSPNDTIMFQVPCSYMPKISRSVLRSWLRDSVKAFWIYKNICKVVVQLKIGALLILKGKQWSMLHVDGMNLNVTAIHLLLELPTKMKRSDYEASRYDDKEELRYSLRSLEMYAPWVRKVFLVTNGQIPSWLELENPKLSVITHQMIFPNRSHLPTFSSPAIETHLHRIPGLSQRFLYLNDDILFGDHVLPEDFISHREGQKVYLTWPIPDCSGSCPWSWVKDGACDLPCNVSTCAFDGGDCLEDQSADLYADGGNHADYDDMAGEEKRRKRDVGGGGGGDSMKDVEKEMEKLSTEEIREEKSVGNNMNRGGEVRMKAFEEKHEAESSMKRMKEESSGGEFSLTKETRKRENVGSKTEKNGEELSKEKIRKEMGTEEDRKVIGGELSTEEARKKNSVERRIENCGGELSAVETGKKLVELSIKGTRIKCGGELSIEETGKENGELKMKVLGKGRNVVKKSKEGLGKEELETNEIRKKWNAESNVKEEMSTEGSTKESDDNDNKEKMKRKLRIEDIREVGNVESKRNKMKKELITGEIDKKLSAVNNRDKIGGLDLFSNSTRLFYDDKQQLLEKNSNKPVSENNIKAEFREITEHFHPNWSSMIRRLYNDIIPYRHKNCSRNYLRRVTNSSVVTAECKYLWNINSSRNALKMKTFSDSVVHERFRRNVGNDTAPKNEGERNIYVEKVEINKINYNNQIKNAAKARAKELGKQFLYNNTERPRKLDTYAESLLHVNALLNDKYGFKRRKVPAHMPHLIDKTIISELQTTFPDEFEQTSSRKIRSLHDMQFAFSYFYFLMSEETQLTVEQIFDMYDTDKSGTWSDREIRTILTRLFPIPLQRNSIVWFEQALLNCAQKRSTVPETITPMYERYLGSVLPLIPESLVVNCKEISHVLRKKFGSKKRFHHVVMQHHETVGFYMVGSNLSELLLSLDSIRSKPKKFICLNDNMDPNRVEDNEIVRAALIDFYHSLFPKPSQFELPPEYVNRFLYYDDYLAWRRHHNFVSNCITIAVVLIGGAAFVVIFKNELRWLLRRLNRIWRGEKMISRKRSGALYTRSTPNNFIKNVT